MLLLFMPVVIVLSVSVVDVVSEPQVGTSGFTERTIVPSSTTECWSPSCLTWSQCLADTSQCFTSHTTVIMLHGEYILHEIVDVSSVVSLSIYGSRSEVNGSVRENQVVINCEYREGGIGFTNITDLSLSGITMIYCGSQGDKRLGFSYFALAMIEMVNVNLSFLFIINSTQTGLLCINMLGTSVIQDSVITHSNYRLLEKYMQGEVECSAGYSTCHGNNVWVFHLTLFMANSNVSNFLVKRTKISCGVNLVPNEDARLMGAGIAFQSSPGLEYDVHITIDKCNITNNIAPYAAHLFVQIFSRWSLIVKDSNFTYANRLTEGDHLELVPVVQPDIGTLMLQILDDYSGSGTAVDVDIGIKHVHIAENVGGGLDISFFTRLSQSYIRLKVQNVEVVRNFLIQHHYREFGVVTFNSYPANAGGMYISLESVDISSNVPVIENTLNREPFGVESNSSISALAVRSTEVHFKRTTLSDNSMLALYSYSGDLHYHGVNVFRNNTGRHCGGALVLRMNSHIYLHKGTQVYIIENTALKYGGGICVDDGFVPRVHDVCFWQVVDPDISNTFVYLEGNVAPCNNRI